MINNFGFCFNMTIAFLKVINMKMTFQKTQQLDASCCTEMCEIPANISAHDRKLREQKLEEEEDLVDKLLKKSGCTEEHYLVQECMVEHQDWRKCQKVLKNFQACISKNSTSKPTNLQ